MRAPVVHHAAYVSPLPRAHRFPMPKFGRLIELLRAHGLARPAQLVSPEPAPRAWLELAHEPAYVTAVLEQRLAPAAERRIGLPMSPELAMRGRCAVAGTVLAGRLALEHGLACNTAGGSHHAFADFGAGFCVFNDVAVAARVTTCSVHCRTNFPARKQASDLDVALDPGTGDATYLELLSQLLPALLARTEPDLVFYNAGVDPHIDDRLGRLALTDRGLRDREALVLAACRRRGAPLACVVGGGYADDIDLVVRRHAFLHEAIADLPGW